MPLQPGRISDAQEQVSERAFLLATSHPDSREHRFYLKTQMLENRGEEKILFKAISTTSVVDELALDIFLHEGDRDVAMWVEILEGDRNGVHAMELLPRRRMTLVYSETLEVPLEIAHGLECTSAIERCSEGSL